MQEQNNKEQNNYVTAAEYARMHKKDVSTIRTHMLSGRIPAKKENGIWKVDKNTPYPINKISEGCKFGMLEVVKQTDKRGKKGHIVWECKCSCGNPLPVFSTSYGLIKGEVVSCGCQRKERAKKVQKVAVEAAKKSPKSGRFVTNVNAKKWKLIAPDGRIYECTNLNLWAHENAGLFGFEPGDKSAAKIAHGFTNIVGSWTGKRKNRVYTYKGWRIAELPEETNKNS